jgi:hypothetical protein
MKPRRLRVESRNPETFGASVISSVIALAKSETEATNQSRRKHLKRQFADIMRVVLKTLVFGKVSENCGKDSPLTSQTSLA